MIPVYDGSTMIKISKMADYAMQILSILMQQDGCMSVAKCAEKTALSEATVSKVSKALVEAGILVSLKGAKGGYQLAIPPETISLARIVGAIDGPLALTECSKENHCCPQQASCIQQHNWKTISQIIFDVLDRISLADMAMDLSQEKVRILQFMPMNKRATL